MTILIDHPRKYPGRRVMTIRMVSDTSERELHCFAKERLKLRPNRFVNGTHYELSLRTYVRALDAGAIEVTAEELDSRNCLEAKGRNGLPETH